MRPRSSPLRLGDPPSFLGRGFGFPPALDRRWGRFEMVEGETDVQQAVQIIIGTAKGERVMRTDFGCGIHDLVHEAVSAQLIADIKRTVTEALVRFEARIDVLRVNVRQGPRFEGDLNVDVHYRVRTTNQPGNYTFPFYIKEGP